MSAPKAKWVEIFCPQCKKLIQTVNLMAVEEYTAKGAHGCGFTGTIVWKNPIKNPNWKIQRLALKVGEPARRTQGKTT